MLEEGHPYFVFALYLFFWPFFCWWGGVFSVFPWENFFFRYVFTGKPLLSLYSNSTNLYVLCSSNFLFALAGKLYFLDVFRGKRTFSVYFHGN